MPNMEWNKVTVSDTVSGFPCDEGEYLFTNGKEVIMDELFIDVDHEGNLICWLDTWDIEQVVAWMPLPQPYKNQTTTNDCNNELIEIIKTLCKTLCSTNQDCRVCPYISSYDMDDNGFSCDVQRILDKYEGGENA